MSNWDLKRALDRLNQQKVHFNSGPSHVQLALDTLYGQIEFTIKITGDSLLIHEFAYSLFIGLCSVTSDLTGYSHSYHSIKLTAVHLKEMY